jgi:hypothetical protein
MLMRSLASLIGAIGLFFCVACGSSDGASGASGAGVAGAANSAAGSGGAAAGPTNSAGASGASDGSSTSLSGKLGALGSVQPTVSSLVISNSGETLIYMSSATITCDQLSMSRWLGAATAGSQVIEVVVKGTPTVGTVKVPPAEVNYAAGGKSSAYEVVASSGSITITKAVASGAVDGSLMATYSDGSSVSGTFHAEFCAGGQGY